MNKDRQPRVGGRNVHISRRDASKRANGPFLHESLSYPGLERLNALNRALSNYPLSEDAPARTGAALWHGPNGDEVVIVTGYYDEPGPDDRDYAQIAGSGTGILVDELAWPRRPIDLTHVRRCLAAGNRQGIETHLTLCGWRAYLEPLVALLDTAAQDQRAA